MGLNPVNNLLICFLVISIKSLYTYSSTNTKKNFTFTPNVPNISLILFLYIRYFLSFLIKFNMFQSKVKLIAWFIDLTLSTSFITRNICLKYRNYFVVNSWLYGILSNKIRLVLHINKLPLEISEYCYFLSQRTPDLIFFVNPLRINKAVENELSSCNVPLIYFVQYKAFLHLFNNLKFFTLFFVDDYQLYFYLVLFNKLLKHYKMNS